VLDGLNS